MRPIQNIHEVKVGAVLWHAAFGFARARGVDGHAVQLEWTRPGDNLPSRVQADALTRAYALCPPGGLFHRVPDEQPLLRDLAQVDPVEVIRLLLHDLDGPQARTDLREWLAEVDLVADAAFDRWWQRVQPLLVEDPRFRLKGDLISARDIDVGDLAARLNDPALPSARRLDLALQHRAHLGDERFLHEVLAAWRAGPARVRDLALASVPDASPDVVLNGLLGPGPESLEALAHALRHADYTPNGVREATQARLIERCEAPTRDPDEHVDAEARFAAVLWRWGCHGVEEALARSLSRGRADLIEGALAALPPRRAEALAASVFRSPTAQDHPDVRRRLAAWMVDHAEGGPLALIERYAKESPVLANACRAEIDARAQERDDLTLESEEAPRTAEIDAPAPERARLSDYPPLIGRDLLPIAAGVATALRDQHVLGRLVQPTLHQVLVQPPAHVSFDPTPDPRAPARPAAELPSYTADLYAAGTLLVEAILGKTWPRALAADRALPFLRHVAPSLPAAALGPLAAALDPRHDHRVDADTWVQRWNAAVEAESQRAIAHEARTRLRVGYDSHIGRMKLLHSQTNQDALYVSVKGTQSLMVVCDGISTANTGSGDLAAGITAQVVASLWEQSLPRLVHGRAEDAHDFLDRALRTANQAVCEASLRLAGGRLDNRVPMGTTAVVACGQGNRVALASLGDSRAYLVGPYGAAHLTADANQAGERLVDWQRGLLGQFDATGFALVRYVGHFDEEGKAQPIPALHAEVVLLPGERLVLCSDGITDYIAGSPAEAAQVLHTLVTGPDMDANARALTDRANRGGGGDNATAIVASIA